MEQIRDTQKKFCSLAITLAIFGGIALILLGLKPIGKGLILGTIFSILNFIIMGETLPMRIGKSKQKTMAFSLGSILVRYGVMAIPIITAIKMEEIHLAATICGLFMVQGVILMDGIIRLTLITHFNRRLRRN